MPSQNNRLHRSDLGLRHGGFLFCSLTNASASSARGAWSSRPIELTNIGYLSRDEARSTWPSLLPVPRRAPRADGPLNIKRLTTSYATAASNRPRPRCDQQWLGHLRSPRTASNRISIEADAQITPVATSRQASTPFHRRSRRPRSAPGRQGKASRSSRRDAGAGRLVTPTSQHPTDPPMTIERETAAARRTTMRAPRALHKSVDGRGQPNGSRSDRARLGISASRSGSEHPGAHCSTASNAWPGAPFMLARPAGLGQVLEYTPMNEPSTSSIPIASTSRRRDSPHG